MKIMKRGVMFMLMMVFIAGGGMAQSNKRGIGVRLGEPTSVSFKSYLGKNAWEILVGTGSSTWNATYYQNSFYGVPGYTNYIYKGYSAGNPLYLQGRYLFQYPIRVQGMKGSWAWYWGIGGMLKAAHIYYYYEIPGSNVLVVDYRNEIDLGLEVPFGVEYTFEDIPITVWAEASPLLEIIDRPGVIQAFGGIGGRFNF